MELVKRVWSRLASWDPEGKWNLSGGCGVDWLHGILKVNGTCQEGVE